MSRHVDDAWNCAADGPDASDIDGDGPIGSERRGLDMAEAIANGEACEGCGAYPAVCECEPRDTIKTPPPADIEAQIERLHFFMTVSPFAKDPL